MKPIEEVVPPKLVEQVSQALALEYENIVNLVRYYDSLASPGARQLLMTLVTDSLEHADFTRSILSEMEIELRPIGIAPDPKLKIGQALARQLEMEHQMAWTYKQLTETVTETRWAGFKERLTDMSLAEERHALMVERLINQNSA